MAGEQELLASQIAGDLRYVRVWNFEKKKEDDEGVLFTSYLRAVIHCEGRKKCRRFDLCQSRHGDDAEAQARWEMQRASVAQLPWRRGYAW